MGRQGYLAIAAVIIATALFAVTRADWATMLASAIILPLIVFAIFFALSRSSRQGPRNRNRRRGAGEGVDPLRFLARTNPIMFLLFGALTRRADDEEYQELLRSGPFGLGQQGYVVVLIIILAPLVLTLLLAAVTGRLPPHSAGFQ